MSHQHLDLVEQRPGVGEVAAESVASLMWRDGAFEARSARQRREEFVERPWLHRCPKRRPEQVHKKVIALCGRRLVLPLQQVDVQTPYHHEVDRHRSRMPGLRQAPFVFGRRTTCRCAPVIAHP